MDTLFFSWDSSSKSESFTLSLSVGGKNGQVEFLFKKKFKAYQRLQQLIKNRRNLAGLCDGVP